MCVAGGYYSIPLVPPRQYPGLPGLGLRSVGTPRRISESIGPGPGPARRASAAQAGPSSVFWPGDRSGFYIGIFFCWFQSTSSAHIDDGQGLNGNRGAQRDGTSMPNPLKSARHGVLCLLHLL